MDADAERIGQREVCGEQPFMFRVTDRYVDLHSMKATCELVGLENRDIKSLAPLWLLDNGTLERCLVDLVLLVCSKGESCSRLFRSVASQVMWAVSANMEDALMKGMQVNNIFGDVVRPKEPAPDDTCADLLEASSYWHPRNPYLTKRELSHYILCSQATLSTASFISVSGPDGTKVGSDLKVEMSYIAAPETGIVAVAAPQESYNE